MRGALGCGIVLFPIFHTRICRMKCRPSPVVSLLAGSLVSFSALAATPPDETAALAQIRDAAMHSDYAYERLTDLTDLIGPRLSGSAGAAAAVTQVADAMRKLGVKVTLQPVKVPHW